MIKFLTSYFSFFILPKFLIIINLLLYLTYALALLNNLIIKLFLNLNALAFFSLLKYLIL